MLGSITGDIIGSVYEFDNTKDYNFPLFSEGSEYTDDSIMAIAVAFWLLTDKQLSFQGLEDAMVEFGGRYPYPYGGYGESFSDWLFSPESLSHYGGREKAAPYVSKTGRSPYGSWGNGSAMRVPAVGWFFDTLGKTEEVAAITASITHNHPGGIAGAQATAAAIWMARNGRSKDEIRDYIERVYGYDLHKTWEEWHRCYYWQSSCQGTVPQAIICFLDSTDYVDAIRKAVSLGGDSDTLACITCGIAEAFYGEIPDWIREIVLRIIPREFVLILEKMRKESYYGALKMDYHLDRFEKAQEGVWQAVLNEIEEGRKRSHWIWFVFPQLKGLGISLNADFYGISGSGEASAYLAHPLLGARLREVCGKLLAIEDKKIEEIIPGIDAVKLRSSMTLFDSVSPDDIFAKVLEKYYQGARDTLTLEMLAAKR